MRFRVLGFSGTGFHVPVSWLSWFGVSRSGFSAFRSSVFHVRGVGVRGFVYGVWGLEFGVFGVSRLGLGVSRSGFQVRGFPLAVRVSCSGFMIFRGLVFHVWGFRGFALGVRGFHVRDFKFGVFAVSCWVVGISRSGFGVFEVRGFGLGFGGSGFQVCFFGF